MSVVIRIAGNLLGTIGGDIRRAVSDIIKETAQELRDTDIQLVPVLTGALQSSIRIEPEDELHTSVIEGGKETYYGVFVEFGTSKQVAQPHFTPACEQAARYFERELKNIEQRIK